MRTVVGGFGLKTKRAFADEAFATVDPGEVFVNAFRWLLGHPDYVKVIMADSRLQAALRKGSPLPADQQLLRKSDIYLDTRDAIADCLTPISDGADERVVAEESLIDARDAFWLQLRRASSLFEFVAATVALLDAIEKRLASPLITAFRSRRSNSSPIAVPVAPTAILPKPKAGFGSGIVDTDRFPPLIDLPDEAIVLREYFGRLAVTPFTAVEPQTPTPALHVQWNSGLTSREEPQWRVAMLSILADVADVDWRPTGGRFRGTDLANERVRVRLDWALRMCDSFEPDLIIIPELNIDERAKETLVSWLRREPRGPDQTSPVIIYGALHYPDPVEEGAYRNQPGVLTPAREVQWDYWKRFGVRGKLAIDGEMVDENLGQWPSHVLGIDLPFGRVAVLICKDFLMDQTRAAVQQLLPTVLVVPAMTSADSVENFQALAKTLASSLRCITLFCNSSVFQRQPWRAPESDAPRVLGVLHSNTKKRSYARPPHHVLDDDMTRAVVGFYTVNASEKGLEVSTTEEYLTPGEEDALAALR